MSDEKSEYIEVSRTAQQLSERHGRDAYLYAWSHCFARKRQVP